MDSGDEEDQMAAMMGFSSFAAPAETLASKKRKISEALTESGEPARPPAAKGVAAHNSNYMPLGQPRERVKSEAGKEGPKQHIGGMSAAHPALSKELEELNSDDIYALRKGVPDGAGGTVYFQASFIETNPWAKLDGQKG